MESDLKEALVKQIEKFLLKFGRGFMFVGTQQRVTINNAYYYVDMAFYNKPLKSYVIIELKTTKLMPEAAGQLNMYLNLQIYGINLNKTMVYDKIIFRIIKIERNYAIKRKDYLSSFIDMIE